MKPITPIQYDFYKRRIGELIEQYPHLFNKRFPIPLAIGITQSIADNTAFSYVEAATLLRVWCSRREYFMMMCSVGSRQGIDGSMTLLNVKHLEHATAVLQTFPLKQVATFARRFKLEFTLNPFKLIPEDKNPENFEGYRAKPIPNYIAELHNVQLNRRGEGDEVEYGLAWGNIMNDRATYGNHPMRNGADMHTSRVVQVWSVSDYTFIKTVSESIYLVRGEINFI